MRPTALLRLARKIRQSLSPRPRTLTLAMLVWAALFHAPLVLVPVVCLGQAPAGDFPRLYDSEQDREAQPMPAEQAARSIQLPPGFAAQVFASEPQVQNPIAMTWDPQGRLWIAENYTYAERSQRFDLTLRDRVIVLEDEDQDGRCDRRTVFTDRVQMLTSVEVGLGGVWLMCPPQLLFIPDRDHDLVPDGPAEVVLDGFTVAKDNYHNFANGLRWGPDGWLYGRCGGSCPGRVGVPGTRPEARVALEGGIWRYHPTRRTFEVLAHGTTNPWGHDWNQWGEAFFVNTVNGHLWHLIPGSHLKRPFTLDPNTRTYELMDMHADHWHFDTGKSWTDSRNGAANALGGGHAHMGTLIYQGGRWPDSYSNRLLTVNLHGRRLNQERLERHGSGYLARHEPDFAVSQDDFFRGLDLRSGPHGDVFLIDWSDTGECHEHTGVHRGSGRVFRLDLETPEDPKHQAEPRSLPNLYGRTPEQLVALHDHPNQWYVRQARLVLMERKGIGTLQADALEKVRQGLLRRIRGADSRIACYALWTLHALGQAEPALLSELLSHENEHVRTWAVRLMTDDWLLDDVFGIHPQRRDPAGDSSEAKATEATVTRLCRLAEREPSGLVRLALASTLSRLPAGERGKLAEVLMRRAGDAEDANLPLLVWYGLMPVVDHAPLALAELAVQSMWPKTQRLIVRGLAEQLDRQPQALDRVLELASDRHRDSERLTNILQGIIDGLRGWSRAKQPKHWELFAEHLRQQADAQTKNLLRELQIVFGDGRALEEVRKIVVDSEAEIGLRRSALETLVRSPQGDIREICLGVLSDPRLNVIAAQGLSRYGDAEVASELVKNYRRFRSPQRSKVVALLSSQPTFAARLLDAIEKNQIPAADVSPYDIRQIRSHNDAALSRRVTELWGEVRDTPEKQRQHIERLKAELTEEALQRANLSNGRRLFQKSCMKCHRLYGEGEQIGPDLTGANRGNLDYLLENIVSPSAVVSKDYTMTIIELQDGRVLNGLVISRNERVLAMQTPTELVTLERDSIKQLKRTTLSPMPEGLVDTLDLAEVRDLFAYLMHPTQVPLVKIPGAATTLGKPPQ